MNLIGMDSFADVTAGLRTRLLAWIDRIEGGHKPGIAPPPSRPSRQLRVEKRDLMAEYSELRAAEKARKQSL